MRAFLAELKRRHVYKVGAMYCVSGWLLVQIVTQVLPIYDIDTHVQRLVVGVIIAGLPVALILAWIYDLTPQGIVRTPAATDTAVTEDAPSAPVQRRLNYVLASLLLVALAVLVAEHLPLRRTGAPPGTPTTIAVLPLRNTSGDPANEYFSDGLSEELIAVLARQPGLKVIGRNSAFQFKNADADSRVIGDKLGVTTLLEGSVRKQGSEIRTVAELVNAADGSTLWSATYDRQLSDVFAIQSEIAEAVASQLRLRFRTSMTAAGATHDVDAYDALLQGDYLRDRRSREDLQAARHFYEQALQRDPRFAIAHARLAMLLVELATVWLESPDELQQASTEARAHAQRAVELAPDSPESHSAQGAVLTRLDLDFQRAETAYREALRLAPGDPTTSNTLAFAEAARGRIAEAESLVNTVIELDPLSVGPRFNRASIRIARGALDAADQDLQRAIALRPEAQHGYRHQRCYLHLLRGEPSAILSEEAAAEPGFWSSFHVAMARQRLPDRKAADTALQQFTAQYGNEGEFQIAELHALRHEPEQMMDWLERAYAHKDAGLAEMAVEPFMLAYAHQPRFESLCRQLGIDPDTLPASPAT